MSNDSWLPFLFFGIVIALTISIVLWAARYARKRTEELAQIAKLLGFSFLGNTWRGPVLSPVHKTCVIQRTRGKVKNVMMGSFGGLPVALFDYTYQMGKSTVTLTLVSFTHERQVPPFELRSESVFDRIGDAFVHRDIDFDSNPEFSRRYFLRSPDEEGARSLFTTDLLSYFEQIPSDKKWHVESSAQTLIVYRYVQLIKAAEIPSLLDESSAIARTILSAAR